MTELLKRKFYFARHGKTDWNDKQLCQGRHDTELNEAGREESRNLAVLVKNVPFTKIYSSPLKRAAETARIVQSFHSHTEIEYLDELMERGWGELEGISSEEMYAIEELEERNEFNLISGIETRADFKLRILKGLNKILLQEERPLIISHGRVFLVMCDYLSVPIIRQIPNTTLITCTPSLKGWDLSMDNG